MKPDLGEAEDTDEEYFDDPITLFESDENAVYFGSHTGVPSITKIDFSWQSEKTENDAFCRPRDISAFRRPSELTETSQSSSMSECDFLESSVKLVDCGKFPWYFRKYTQQILDKTRLNLDSDSDSEIDVVDIKDCKSDDCFIVDNLPAVPNKFQNCQVNECTENALQTKLKLSKNEKRQKSIKRKEDIEIQRALSLKNIAKLDLKRNQGLVGMKITQKIIKNVAVDVTTNRSNEVKVTEKKRNDKMGNETYINAADKTLSYIGTQLIPIPKQDVLSQFKVKIDEEGKILRHEQVKVTEKSTGLKRVPVQLSLFKISEKLFDNIKEKKIRESVSEDKIKSKVSNNSLLKCSENKLIEANENDSRSNIDMIVKSSDNSSSHIKDVKKTNKYKNDLLKKGNKADHSAVKEILISKPNKIDSKDLKYGKQTKHEVKDVKQNEVVDLTKNQYKRVEKRKREPNSPILPCSTLSKKPKVKQEMPSQCNNSDVNLNILKEGDNLNKTANKLANVDNSRGSQNAVPKKNVISKRPMDTKPSHVPVKQVSQKETTMLHDKNIRQANDVHALSTKVTDREVKNCNDVHNTNFKSNTQSTSVSHNNKTPIEQNLISDTYENKFNKHSITIVSVASTPIKHDTPKISDKDLPRAIVITPRSEPKSAIFLNKFNKCPVKNSSSDKTSQGNTPNNNINGPVNIILKPNHQINFKVGNHVPERPAQTRGPERPTNMPIPIHTQPRFWNNPNLQPGYYQSVPFGRYQNYLPRSLNCSVPNRFPPPKGIESICRQLSNHTPIRYAYKGWLPQNITPPPPPPPPPLNMPSRTTRDRDVNQTTYCSYVNPPLYPSVGVSRQPQGSLNQNMVNISQPKKNFLFGRTNDDKVKNIFAAVPESEKNHIKEGTVKVEVGFQDIQIVPDGMPEVVATKTEMLEELDKLSFAEDIRNDLKRRLHDSINRVKKASNFEMETLSKKPRTIETKRITVKDKSYDRQIDQSKGYSPPILPIPTYQTFLDQRQAQNEKLKNTVLTKVTKYNVKDDINPIGKKEFDNSCKNKLNQDIINKLHGSDRKEDAKKISLEEYKKRIFKNESRPDTNSSKKTCREKSKSGGKVPNIDYKYRENVDYSTETDLGYDSDSTVVL